SLDEHEGVLVEQAGVLNIQDAMRLDDWSSARLLRRLAALRAENRGVHEFGDGPKNRAFRRLLARAGKRGRVILMILPVSHAYAEAFLDNNSVAAFDKALDESMAVAPEAMIVRVDRVPGILDHRYFADLVHMNSEGRRVATALFLNELSKHISKP